MLLTLAFLVTATGCGSNAPTKGEAFVYVAVPLSGFQANAGQTVLGGVRLMAEQLNNSGGLLGYRVQVVGLDDESDSDVALAVAEQIRSEVNSGRRVAGIVGHLNSGQTLAAMEVYKDLSLIVMTPTASEVSLTQRGYRNFFRINANDAVQAKVDAGYLVNTLRARRIALVHNDTEYGVGLRDQMSHELAGLGAEVAITIQVTEGQETYSKELVAIRQSNADAIFYAGYEIEAPYLRFDVVQAGIDVPFLASDGAFLSATIDEAEGTAEGMYVSGFAPSPKQAVGEDWVRQYQEVEFRNPDTYSINGYAALQVLAEGVKKANTLASDQVSDAIRALTIKTPMGEFSYQPNGDLREAPVYIFQVRASSFEQVYP